MLERLAGLEQERRDQRRIVLAAQAIDDRLDRLDVLLGLADLGRHRAGLVVEIEARRRVAESLDHRIEAVGGAAEVGVEHLGHVVQEPRLRRVLAGLALGQLGQTHLEHAQERLGLTVGDEAAAQPAHLDVGLHRRVDRALEQLLGLIGLAARRRDRGQLVEHLALADRGLVVARRLPAHDQQQRAIGALGLVALTGGAEQLGQLALDAGVVDVHLGRRLHLGQRLVELALGVRDLGQLDVEHGALGRAATTEALDQLGEHGPGLGQPAGDAQADRQLRLQLLVGGIDRERALERGDGLGRRAELLGVDRRGLASQLARATVIAEAIERAREVSRQRLPVLTAAVQIGEHQAQLERRLAIVEVRLDRGNRAIGLLGGEVGLGELVHHAGALAAGDRRQQALEPRHGLGRLTAIELESRQRAERVGGGGQRHDAAVAGDRAIGLAGVALGDAGEPRPQPRRLGRIAAALEPRGLDLEQIGQRLVLALAGQVRGDRVDRRVVAGLIVEVRGERLEATTLLLDDADQPRDVEAQLEAPRRVLLEPELELPQAEQLGDATLGVEERAQAIDDLEIAGAVGEHAAVHVDRRGVVAEFARGHGSGAQAQLAAGGQIERQARRLDEEIDRGARTPRALVQLDQAIDRPPHHRLRRSRRGDRRRATPRRGGAPEHLPEDRQRHVAIAQTARGVGGLDQHVEVAGVGVGQATQHVEQRRGGATGAEQVRQRAQRVGAIAAGGQGLAERADRRGAIAAGVAMQERELAPPRRRDRRRQRELGRGALERGGEPVDRTRGAGRGLERRPQPVVEALLGHRVATERERGVGPVAVGRRQADHARGRDRLPRIVRVHPRVLGERRGGIGQPLVEHASADHAQPRGLVAIVTQRHDGARQRVGGGGMVERALGEREDLAFHHAVARRQRERLDQVRQRADAVVEVGLADVRGLAQEREPGAIVAGVGEARRHQLQVARPVLALAVAGGQRVGGGLALGRVVEEPDQAGPRHGVDAVDRERGAVRRQRARRLSQVLGERLAQAVEAPGGALDVTARGALEQIRHLAPAPGAGEQLGQRADVLGVVAEGRGHALPRGDRRRRVVQMIALHDRDARQIGAALRRRHVLARAGVERGHQLGPATGALEQRDHRVERGQIVAVVADALPPQRQRAIGLAERLGQPRRVADHRASGRRRRLEAGQLLEDLEPLARTIDPRVQLRQPPADVQELLGPRALEAQRALVQLDRAGGVVEQIEPGPRRLRQELDLAADDRGGLRGGGDALGVAGVVVRALRELAQLLLRHRRLGLEREQRRVVIHRGLIVVELGQARAGLLAQRLAGLGIELDRALEHADDLARPTGGVVVRAQQIERGVAILALGVGRHHDALEQPARLAIVLGVGQERPHRGQRLGRVAEVVEVTRRDASAALLALGLGLALEAALPQRDQIGPALVALEQALERQAELVIVGRERQEPLQVPDGLLRLVRDILRELRGLAQELDAAAGVLHRGERAIVEPQQIGPALVLRVEHAQATERGLGLRRQIEHLAEDALGDLGLVAEPLVAERRGALADHLDHLGIEALLQGVAVHRDHVIGLVQVPRQLLELVPRRRRVRGALHVGSGGREIALGHDPSSNTWVTGGPVRGSEARSRRSRSIAPRRVCAS